MTSEVPLPSKPEDVTAEWFTQVLNASGDGPEVTVGKIEVLDQHSGTTGRMRVGLEYSSDVAGPPTVFVKLPPFDADQQDLVAAVDMGRREARFYQGPAKEVPIRIPKAYYAAADDDDAKRYVMVLEDLEASGCSFTTRVDSHAEENGGQIIESFARLHATFWNDPRFETDFSWLTPAMRGVMAAELIKSAQEQFAAELPPVFTELCELYVANWQRIYDIWDEGPQTLIHGDTHAGNQFIDNGRVGFYDWAVISRSPGIRDVAIYLGTSCPTDVRRANQEEWLRRYREVLVESGVDAPSSDELWTGYRKMVLRSWIAATTTAAMGSKWQPIEIGRLGMTRGTDACADLDTIDAIREAL